MAEYTAAALQTVDQNQNVLFTEAPVPCTRGLVIHRDGSGVFTLRGITNSCSVLYRVQFQANVALPEGATVGPITVALAIEGEPIATSEAIFTPAAAEDFGNVTVPAIVRVPRGCCTHIAIENISTPATPIDVQNANIEITRVVG